MTKSIYEQHEAAFSNVSAYVIVKDNERIATVAFKYPKDGAGRLWCYLHIIGLPMVRGYADGYGYDKHRAAFDNTTRQSMALEKWQPTDGYKQEQELRDKLQSVVASNASNGRDWQALIYDAFGDDVKIWWAV